MHPTFARLVDRSARRLLTLAQVCPTILDGQVVGEDLVLVRQLMQVTLRRTCPFPAASGGGSTGRHPTEHVASVGRGVGDEHARYHATRESLRRLDPVVPDRERMAFYFQVADLTTMALLYGPDAEAAHGGTTEGLTLHLQHALRDIRPLGWAERVLPQLVQARRVVHVRVAAARAHVAVVDEHRWKAAPSDLALAAGRAAREAAQFNRAARWFRRGIELAEAGGDPVAASRGWGGLGKTFRARGQLRDAERALGAALRLARGAAADHPGRMKAMAYACHDLSSIGMDRQDHEAADRWAKRAADLYMPGDPFLTVLAHDVALHWTDRGDCSNATVVLHQVAQGLPGGVEDPLHPMRCYANLARAAGGAGEKAVFGWAWEHAWMTAEYAPVCLDRATAFTLMALGAIAMREWDNAESALSRARETALSSPGGWALWPRANTYREARETLARRSAGAVVPRSAQHALALHLVARMRLAA